MDQLHLARTLVVTTTLLLPCLIALGAGLGVRGGRRFILITALIALVVLLFGQIGTWLLRPVANTESLDPTVLALQRYLPLAGYVGQLGSAALILAVTRAGQLRRWVWFAPLVAAMVVHTLSILLSSNLAFVLLDYQRAQEISQSATFQIGISVLIDATLLVAAAYGAVGPTTPRGERGALDSPQTVG